MIMIPGYLIALATFPGVIIHEAAHRFFCDIAKVPVYEVSYFRIGDPAGYVIHGPTKGLKDTFLISIGPIIVNSLLCMILTLPVTYPMIILGAQQVDPILYVIAWAGVSIGMHAFPSDQDMNIFQQEVKKAKKTLLYYLALPFTLLVKLANLLRVVWFDLFYAIALSWILPNILLSI